MACLESRSTDLDILGGTAVRKAWGPLICSSPGNSAPHCHFHGDSDLDYQFPESAGRWQDRCCFWKSVPRGNSFPLSLPVAAKCPADSPGDSAVAVFQKGSMLLSKAITLVTSPHISQGYEINLLLRWALWKNGHVEPGTTLGLRTAEEAWLVICKYETRRVEQDSPKQYIMFFPLLSPCWPHLTRPV